MAFTAIYNNSKYALTHIFRSTSGGTVFSANYATTAAFDYFTDTAVLNDALYFSNSANSAIMSDFDVNVGTAMAGTGIVLTWEYYRGDSIWAPIENLQDDTNGFTVLGANTIRFPAQWWPKMITINTFGNKMWIRCRISAITSISEGGANQTTAIKTSNSVITISGTTDAVPATFADVYNWLRTNKPYIGVTFTNSNAYDFTKVGLNIQSRLVTYDEVISIGQNATDNLSVTPSTFNYLTSGTKIGTDRGYRGSTFIIYGVGNSGVCGLDTNAKIYGTTFRVGKIQSSVLGYPGYFAMAGEIVDSNFEVAPSFGGTSANTITNSRIFGPFLLTGGFSQIIKGLTYITTQAYIFFHYITNTGWTLSNFSYKFLYPTNGIFLYLYSQCEPYSPNYYLVNPEVPLTSMADNQKPCYQGNGGPYSLNSCFYYDASAGTYTDYTTQASNVTTNDVPLGGDIGDCYYFGTTNAGYKRNYMHLKVTKNTEVNDYSYVWEYNIGANWFPITTYLFDGTANLSSSGYILIAVPNNVIDTVVNGVTRMWLRARITGVGTISPTATQIQSYYLSGVGGWSLKEQFSTDIKVVDTNGAAISGVTVSAKYTGGADIFSVTTGVNGAITQQMITDREWKIDATKSNVGNMFIGENITQLLSLTISKAGYETYQSSGVILNKKLDLTITLTPSRSYRSTIDGNLLLVTNPEKGSSSNLIEI